MRKLLLVSAIFVVLLSTGLAYGAPIHDAAAKGDWNKIEALLKSGTPVDSLDQKGQTALFVASGYGYVGVAKLLLKWGANPNIATKDGWNSRDAAKFNGKVDVDELLKRHGGKYQRKATWNP